MSELATCQHVKVNGIRCGSPALRGHNYCYFHNSWRTLGTFGMPDALPELPPFEMPVFEDANSIQIALMHIVRMILAHRIDRKTAGLLLYALQTAAYNLKRTQFEPYDKNKVVVDLDRLASGYEVAYEEQQEQKRIKARLKEEKLQQQSLQQEKSRQEKLKRQQPASLEVSIPEIHAVADPGGADTLVRGLVRDHSRPRPHIRPRAQVLPQLGSTHWVSLTFSRGWDPLIS
jgi:hypothetical protein